MKRSRGIWAFLGALVLQFVFTPTVFALSAGNLKVTAIQARTYDNAVFFATNPTPAGTCPLAGGINFTFDASTATGKVFLTVLLTAKATGKLVQVSYKAFKAPCSENTMAVADTITVFD